MSWLSLGTSTSNMKSVALTILEQLAFNAHPHKPCSYRNTQTDTQRYIHQVHSVHLTDISPNSIITTSPWHPQQTSDVPIDLSATAPTSPCLVADAADFPVSSTQTGLLPTCHGNFSNPLDMSRWFETPKLPCDFSATWSMSATSPKLSCDTWHRELAGKSA